MKQFKEFYIGNVLIKHPTVLAPMAGVTNKPFREVIDKINTIGLLSTEMISDKGIVYENTKTLSMLDFPKLQTPVAVQLFGKDVKTMVDAAKFIDKNTNADIIDINMGCPVNKVIKKNGGGALLQTPELIKEIVESIVEVVDKPVTVKIRLGWNNEQLNYIEIAKIAEAAGASAITMHARTVKQMYTGTAYWEHIKNLKDAVSIPVIGNGDVTSPELAQQLFEETNCDAIMIGRGAFHNPYIFKEVDEFLCTGSYDVHDQWMDKRNYIIDLTQAMIDDRSESVAVKEMRKFSAWVLNGFHSGREYKSKLARINTFEELKEIISEIDKANEEQQWKEANKN